MPKKPSPKPNETVLVASKISPLCAAMLGEIAETRRWSKRVAMEECVKLYHQQMLAEAEL